MTHHPIRTLEDGTRVYSRFQKYKPLAAEDRKYAVRKPADPRAVRFRGDWFLPLAVLPDEARAMPETRSDEEAYEHMGGRNGHTCHCEVCSRPPEWIGRWQRKWRSDRGLRP